MSALTCASRPSPHSAARPQTRPRRPEATRKYVRARAPRAGLRTCRRDAAAQAFPPPLLDHVPGHVPPWSRSSLVTSLIGHVPHRSRPSLVTSLLYLQTILRASRVAGVPRDARRTEQGPRRPQRGQRHPRALAPRPPPPAPRPPPRILRRPGPRSAGPLRPARRFGRHGRRRE